MKPVEIQHLESTITQLKPVVRSRFKAKARYQVIWEVQFPTRDNIEEMRNLVGHDLLVRCK